MKSKQERDVLKLFKENGIVSQWKKSVTWDWVLRELQRTIHERDFYKYKYKQIGRVFGIQE